VVIGLFPDADLAGECLSNLEEADFAPEDLSVVMRTRAEVERLASVSGPLNGISPDDLADRLRELGLSASDAAAYRDGVLGGRVFVAVDAGDAADAAKEMLADARAERIRAVGRPGDRR
jgi:hypothetical protein